MDWTARSSVLWLVRFRCRVCCYCNDRLLLSESAGSWMWCDGISWWLNKSFMIKTCASFPVLAYSFHLYILKNSLPSSLLRKVGFFPLTVYFLFVLMPPLSLCSSSSQTPSAAGDHQGLLSALPTLKSLACQVSRDSRYVRKKERQKVWNFVVGLLPSLFRTQLKLWKWLLSCPLQHYYPYD